MAPGSVHFIESNFPAISDFIIFMKLTSVVVRVPSVRHKATAVQRTTSRSFTSTTKLPQDAHSEAPGMRHLFVCKSMVAVFVGLRVIGEIGKCDGFNWILFLI